MCVCVCAASAATPPGDVPTTEAGAKGSPAVPAEASALTDEQGTVLDGNEIKKACLSSEEKSSEEKSSEEKREGRWGAQGRIGKGSAGQKKGLFKTCRCWVSCLVSPKSVPSSRYMEPSSVCF